MPRPRTRSGLETAIHAELRKARMQYEYEPFRIPYTPTKVKHYTPEFVLPNGIIIESKGRFVAQDRQKHLLVQAQHPDLEVRFVFSNSRQRISKQSQTTYGAWCDHKGFLYADRLIPASWLREAPNHRSLEAIRRLGEA